MSKTSPKSIPDWLKVSERVLLLFGVALVGICIAARIDASISSRLAMQAFAVAHESRNHNEPTLNSPAKSGIDFSLWSSRRINAYRSSLASAVDRPLGILSIPRLRLTAPVFEGTGTLTLNRGVGRIEGTAMLGGDGNIGIAGHRDGFFRTLQGIAMGDAIVIDTNHGRDVYIVDRIHIVDPTDIEVLKPQSGAEITLVTCYPFTFIGNAPRRYVVQASLKQRSL